MRVKQRKPVSLKGSIHTHTHAHTIATAQSIGMFSSNVAERR